MTGEFSYWPALSRKSWDPLLQTKTSRPATLMLSALTEGKINIM